MPHPTTTATDSPRLSILFIGGYDSTNYVYVELLREFEARGHACTVVVQDEADLVNNKMFVGAGIATVSLAAFDLSRVDSFDVAFSGQFIRRPQRALFDAIARERVFLVSFANLYSAVTMRAPADLVIATSEDKFDEFAENGLCYNMVAVGNPQYDTLVRARAEWQAGRPERPRRVLIVDQGAYPFGDAGKQQLAECLKGIAAHAPEVTFHIKPRYLPGERGDLLHSLSHHLYHYLDDRPSNLDLIHESTVLEELVLDYDAMVTTWSTAHLDAIALGMPLMLIEGLDSVDVFDVRRQRVAYAYARLKETGCVVDWRQAAQGGGEFRACAESYVTQEFYDSSQPCSPRVVTLIEAIAEEVLRPGRAFAGRLQLGYHEFMDQLDAGLETLESNSRAHALNRELYAKMNVVMQALVFDNRCMGHVLDMTELLHFWAIRLAEDSPKSEIDRIVSDVEATGAEMKRRLFESRPDLVASDPFIQDFYFDWLYTTGRRKELLDYDGPVIVPESLAYDRGLVMLRRGRLFSASRLLVDSFALSLVKPVRVLRKDKNVTVLLSTTDRGLLAHAILFSLNAYRKNEALSALDVTFRPGFEALVYYKAKALLALGRAEEAGLLVREFSEATLDQSPRRRRGLAGWVLGVLIRRYARLLARLRVQLARA